MTGPADGAAPGGDLPDDLAADLADDLAGDLASYQRAEDAHRATLGTDPSVQHPDLLAVSWLLGRWRGEAVLAGDPDVAVTVAMAFDSDGGPALRYACRVTVDTPAGERVVDAEAGWWRVSAPTGVEAVLAHPSGVVEVSVGTAQGGRVELVSDLVARTGTGAPDTAFQRLYGQVGGRLLFAVDVASDGQPLRPRISGSLDRLG